MYATRTTAHSPIPDNDASVDWTAVTLPDQWQHRWPTHDGAVWYRIDWELPCQGIDLAQHPIAIALRSIVLAGEVYLNHDLLWRDAHLQEPLSRSWNRPRYSLIPPSTLRPGVNHIWIRVHGLVAQTPGIGGVHLGDPATLQAWHDSSQWHFRTLIGINLLVSAVLGILFFAAWLMRRSLQAYGWYAFNCACWVLFNWYVLATEAWPFASSMALARANLVLLALFGFSFCIFTWRFGQQRFPRLEPALWAFTGVSLVASLVWPVAYWPQLTILPLMFLLCTLLNALQFAVHAWHTQKLEHRIYAWCILAFLAAGIHDFMLFLQLAQGTPWAPYTAPITMLALALVLGREVTLNIRRIERFNEELTDTVNQACADLSETLQREHTLALRHSRLEERMQLSHDLHDSLGGSLVRSIAYVEQTPQPLPNTQVLSMLKLMRDDLRQLIDQSSSPHHEAPATPGAWAAPLRHRFVGLFDALDIQSTWLIPAQWQQRPSALQCLGLTRVTEEALTNVLKHSRARHVHIELLQPQPHALLLRIRDDGIGFDVPGVQRHSLGVGMRSMRSRLERFHGALHITSAAGATVLEATVSIQPLRPLDVRPRPSAAPVSVDPPGQ